MFKISLKKSSFQRHVTTYNYPLKRRKSLFRGSVKALLPRHVLQLFATFTALILKKSFNGSCSGDCRRNLFCNFLVFFVIFMQQFP